MSDTTASLSADGALTLAVGWRMGRRVEGGRVELTEEVAAELRAVAQEALEQVSAREAKAYSADAHLEPEECFVIDASAVEYGNELVEIVRTGAELPRLTAAQLPGRPLLFHASVIGDDPASRTAFVRTTNPVVALSAGKILTRLRQSLASLHEPVFSFDRKVDFIVGSDGVTVLNQSSFERLFRDLPELLGRIPDWLTEVSAHLPIDDEALAVLDRRCRSDSRLRRRLSAIHDRGHLAEVTVDDIRDEAKHQGIDPDAVLKDGKLTLAGVDAGTLLKLLNEDLMTGGLSGTRFSVERKAPR